MSDQERWIFEALVHSWFVLSAMVFLALLFIVAPYGRHARKGWGPQLPATLGWIMMELPAVLAIAACFAVSPRTPGTAALVLLCLWQVHYINRALIYPLRLRAGRPIPVSVVAMGVFFNLVNGYINGRHLSLAAADGTYGVGWLADPRFLLGAVMFAAGLAINLHSDRVLRGLRRPGQSGYSIPHGGAYRWVSCPNYMGEVLEWSGWAVATWSLPGLAFAVWTAANLVPRALAHHRWYRQKFADYPRQRKAIIPGLL